MKILLISILPYIAACGNKTPETSHVSSHRIIAIDAHNNSIEADLVALTIREHKNLIGLAGGYVESKYPDEMAKMDRAHIEKIEDSQSYRVTWNRMVKDYNYINYKNPITRVAVSVKISKSGDVQDSSLSREIGYASRFRGTIENHQ